MLLKYLRFHTALPWLRKPKGTVGTLFYPNNRGCIFLARNRAESGSRRKVHKFSYLPLVSPSQTSYSDTLNRYTRDMQFFFDQERVEGNFAEVDTRVLDPSQNKTFSINYRLHQVERQWLIYDVVIENASMVQNYHNQCNRIIGKSSYEDLVQRLKNKLQQLDALPSS